MKIEFNRQICDAVLKLTQFNIQLFLAHTDLILQLRSIQDASIEDNVKTDKDKQFSRHSETSEERGWTTRSTPFIKRYMQ